MARPQLVRFTFVVLLAFLAMRPSLVLSDEPAPDAKKRGDVSESESESEPRKTVGVAKTALTDAETFELMRLFVDVLDQIDRNYVERVDRRELMDAAIKGMMSKLDPYSNYIPPGSLDRFKSGVESKFGGIGIQISLEDGKLIIVGPLIGSPAYREGLLSGDHITHIGGKSTKGITTEEAVRRLKGRVGTKVKLTLLHPDSADPVEVTLNREIIKVETVVGDLRDDDDHWDFMFDDENQIAYVRVTSFGRRTAAELRRVITSLQEAGMKGLILDLRFNPGGLLSSAIRVSDMFVSSGRIVSTEGRSITARQWDAKKKGTFDTFPMAVLVNRFSASAAEIVSACLQDHRRAVIVGQRTWGKGSVQNIVELEDGKSALKLTTASYRRPSGKNIHRGPKARQDEIWGVFPDEGLEVVLSDEQTRKIVRERRERDVLKTRKSSQQQPIEDPQFEKALQYLREHVSADSKVAPAEVIPNEVAPGAVAAPQD